MIANHKRYPGDSCWASPTALPRLGRHLARLASGALRSNPINPSAGPIPFPREIASRCSLWSQPATWAPETPLRSSGPSPLSGPPSQQPSSVPHRRASPHGCTSLRPRGREVGLTRRCSGLATLATELHIVRPTTETPRDEDRQTQRCPFHDSAPRGQRETHAGLLPPPWQGSAGFSARPCGWRVAAGAPTLVARA